MIQRIDSGDSFSSRITDSQFTQIPLDGRGTTFTGACEAQKQAVMFVIFDSLVFVFIVQAYMRGLTNATPKRHILIISNVRCITSGCCGNLKL